MREYSLPTESTLLSPCRGGGPIAIVNSRITRLEGQDLGGKIPVSLSGHLPAGKTAVEKGGNFDKGVPYQQRTHGPLSGLSGFPEKLHGEIACPPNARESASTGLHSSACSIVNPLSLSHCARDALLWLVFPFYEWF